MVGIGGVVGVVEGGLVAGCNQKPGTYMSGWKSELWINESLKEDEKHDLPSSRFRGYRVMGAVRGSRRCDSPCGSPKTSTPM